MRSDKISPRTVQTLEELRRKRKTVYSSLPYQTFMVHGIKASMMEAFVYLTSPEYDKATKLKALLHAGRALRNFELKFPEPQKGIHPESGLPYVWHPNSIRLIELRDKFFEHCQLDAGRRRFLRIGINFIIIMYDYDPPYRMMIDWWAKQLDIKNWDFSVPVTVMPRDWCSG